MFENNENTFEGVPALDDSQGLEQYLNNESLQAMGLDGDVQPSGNEDDSTQNVQTPNQETATQYTQEQIAQIIAQNQQLQAQVQQRVNQNTQQNQQSQKTYTPQQTNIIKQLIDNGVPLSRIAEALQGNKTQTPPNADVLAKLNGIEQYLEQQRYNQEYSQFEQKAMSFAKDFGLSETDLVAFGNSAMSQGINIANVPNLEVVFRAIYPDQYAIRSQRRAAMSGGGASKIYGGASASEIPGQSNAKREDSYVEAFLKKSMPQYYTQK